MKPEYEEGFPRLMQAFSSNDPDNTYPIEKWAYNSLDVMLFKKAYEGMDVREGGLTREAILDRMIYCLFCEYPEGLKLNELQKKVKVKLDEEGELWFHTALNKSKKIAEKHTTEQKADLNYSLHADAFREIKEKYEKDMELFERFVANETNRRPFAIRFNRETFTKDAVVYALITLIVIVFALRYFLLSRS